MKINDIDNYFNFFYNDKLWNYDSCKTIFNTDNDIWDDYNTYIRLVGIYAAPALLWKTLDESQKEQLIQYINDDI